MVDLKLRTLIESSLNDPGYTYVAHYTRIGNLRHFLPPGSTDWTSAFASPVQFLNDRKELTLGLEVFKRKAETDPKSSLRVRDIVSTLLDSPGTLDTDAYQMSFSANSDELGQWRGYAANGMGCSVVTEVAATKAAADIAGWIIYDKFKQDAFAAKVKEGLRTISNDKFIERAIIAAACFMKHQGFEQEQEFRLLKFPEVTDVEFRESGDRLIPFMDYLRGQAPLPLKRIIIGPGWQLANLDKKALSRHHVILGVHRLLSARNLQARVTISSSQIPYDPK